MEKTSKTTAKASAGEPADAAPAKKKTASISGPDHHLPSLSGTHKQQVPAIVSEPHPALRQVADEIPLSEIKSPKIQDVIADMKLALAGQSDGIGLAAPQIGISLRIFIVSKKIFATHKANGEDIKPGSKASEEKADANTPALDDLVFINPILVKESKEKKWMDGEGCLSVRWVYGKVKRSTKVTIRAFDQYGRAFERGAGGLLAHIFQHEVDHLNGVLFIDKARDLEEVDQEEVRKSRAKARGKEEKADKKAKRAA